MAVNINTVYTTVLYILNKEQRGYITPTEFNSLATQVQEEIFNSYFPDGNQLNRPNQNNTQNDTEFFNMFKESAYKLYPFEKEITFTYDSVNDFFYNNTTSTIYKIGEVITTYSGQPQYDSITQLVSKKDYEKIIRSKLTAPTKQYPLFTTTSSPLATAILTLISGGTGYANATDVATTGGTGTGLTVDITQNAGVIVSVTVNTYGSGYTAGDVITITGGGANASFTFTPTNQLVLKIYPSPSALNDIVKVNSILKPTPPIWGYTVGSVGQYIFDPVGANASTSVDFELDVSEQTNIITNILRYAGVIINDPAVIQAATVEAQKVEQNEKS
tara:strand:- start:377 stop:1369 length:993 start_codon:yes stop_codon:yes gene_type:complete